MKQPYIIDKLSMQTVLHTTRVVLASLAETSQRISGRKDAITH